MGFTLEIRVKGAGKDCEAFWKTISGPNEYGIGHDGKGWSLDFIPDGEDGFDAIFAAFPRLSICIIGYSDGDGNDYTGGYWFGINGESAVSSKLYKCDSSEDLDELYKKSLIPAMENWDTALGFMPDARKRRKPVLRRCGKTVWRYDTL
jgi:hypothetical protein